MKEPPKESSEDIQPKVAPYSGWMDSINFAVQHNELKVPMGSCLTNPINQELISIQQIKRPIKDLFEKEVFYFFRPGSRIALSYELFYPADGIDEIGT